MSIVKANYLLSLTDSQSPDKLYYKRRHRLFMDQHMGGRRVSVTATQYHKSTRMLVVAFATGDFLLLDMNDEGALVHSLNISKQVC